MKITGPFYDNAKRDQPKPWYLRYSVPAKHPDGSLVLNEKRRVVLKRCRPYYKTRAAAEEDVPAIVAQYGSAGASGAAGGILTRDQAGDFERAKAIVPEVSAEEMAKFWRLHHPLQTTARVRELGTRFAEVVKARIGKTAHYEDLKSRVGIFAATFGDRIPETVTRKEIMTWLNSYPGGAKTGRTLLNLKQAVCNFFNWLLSEGIITHNPAGGIKKRHLPKIAVREIGFLSLDASERYLRALERYDPELVAHEIIQLLAGVRADDEMANFRGDWVLPQTKEIVIPAEIAKTERREVITGVEDVFWSWWKQYGRIGLLRPANYRHRWVRVRVLMDKPRANADQLAHLSPWAIAHSNDAKQIKATWPWNARRRTFVTYHVAKHQSAALTALIIRHRGDTYTLHDSYRGTGVTQVQGTAYFARRPRPVRDPLAPRAGRDARGIVKFRASAQATPAADLSRRLSS